MANYNNNQQKFDFNQLRISTNAIAFFDENGMMLKCGFLDDAVSITFGTPKLDNPDGKRSYPNEMRDSIILKPERAMALIELIMNKILNAIESKTVYNGGVFTSQKKDGIFEIRVENDNVYAIFYKDINTDRNPSKTLVFKFASMPIIEKYNPSSGEFELQTIHTQFLLFVKFLEGYIMNASNSSAGHSYRNSNKFTTDKIIKDIGRIAEKLGIAPNTTNTFYNSGFDTAPNKTSGSTSMPQMAEADSLEGMLS